MTNNANTLQPGSGQYGAQSKLVDFIYGITYEIWEEKGVELIRQYYAEDIDVYALSGFSKGVEAVVQGTYATLAGFPDRLLLPENVVWSADADGDYSSHRIMSPMTNLGATIYGPATGKKVLVRTIADCFVQEGKITREWLIRDTLPIVQQLDADPIEVARLIASDYQPATIDWLTAEKIRVAGQQDVVHAWTDLARKALTTVWCSGDETDFADIYPHYTTLHPDPLTVVSGRTALQNHAAKLRACFAGATLTVDHIAVQPWCHQGYELAVRWTVCAKHSGTYVGLEATQKDVVILGASHWRVVDNQILTDWTVFDGVGVLAQLV